MLYLWSRIKRVLQHAGMFLSFYQTYNNTTGSMFCSYKIRFWRLVLLYFTLFFSDIPFHHWIFFFTRAYTATKGRFPEKKQIFFRALHELGWGCPIFFGQCLRRTFLSPGITSYKAALVLWPLFSAFDVKHTTYNITTQFSERLSFTLVLELMQAEKTRFSMKLFSSLNISGEGRATTEHSKDIHFLIIFSSSLSQPLIS